MNIRESNKHRETPIYGWTRPNFDFNTIVDHEMMRAMQAAGSIWSVEIIPLVDEGQPYTHISSKRGTESEEKPTGIVPMGKVYIQVRSDEKDLTDFWATVTEIHNENSRK